MIRDLVSKNHSYQFRLGKIDPNKGKLWIELKFPDGPPIEYVRPGIELTEDLEWRKATRPVEEAHHHRLNRILLPTEATKALYLDTKRKVAQTWTDLKVYTRLEEAPAQDTIEQFSQRLKAISPSPPSTGLSSTGATPDPLPVSSANDTPRHVVAPSPAPVDGPAKDLGFVLPDPKKLMMDLARFRGDMKKAIKPADMQIPRGTFLVMGLIEVYGDRARMTLSVGAAYDPKQGRYISLKAGVWNFVEHRQHPKGGP